MRLILSFDVEIWCNGWERLDDEFPRAFERYVFGHSRTDGGALPKTLDILRRHALKAVFFVEPLFAARFGLASLREIVDLIAGHDQQIELHLHSEWADEIRPRPLPHIDEKRQHLQQLSFNDQLTLIRMGRDLLHDAGAKEVSAFRAGSFGANSDTFRAVEAAGLTVDSSINAAASVSVPDLRNTVDMFQPSRIGTLLSLPLTVFRDGIGRMRPAQIGSCSFSELRQLIDIGIHACWPVMTMLSHNFEMLRPGSTKIDPIVLRRFEQLCAYVASHPGISMPSGNLLASISPSGDTIDLPRITLPATAQRYGEQLLRRGLPA